MGETLQEATMNLLNNKNIIKYNIYILDGEDGVYNSSLVDTVESEEQAVDRVTELSAETGSNAYYKKVINGNEQEDTVTSNYYDILELLDAVPDSPFDQEEGDTIKDIMNTYPDKTSEEIAQIYNEYCETGNY